MQKKVLKNLNKEASDRGQTERTKTSCTKSIQNMNSQTYCIQPQEIKSTLAVKQVE
jgi:hypothetical protein